MLYNAFHHETFSDGRALKKVGHSRDFATMHLLKLQQFIKNNLILGMGWGHTVHL